MAVDPFAVDALTYSGSDLRLGLLLPLLAGAGSALGVRTGVRPSGSGTDLLVQAQASPNMTVKVNTGSIVVQGGISSTQGPYTWALDTLTNLTISAAHATLARTDLICVRVRDSNVDTSGQKDGAVVVVPGTAGGGVPSLPTDATYVTIAQIAVAAAATSISSGNITDKRTFTAATGGVIPCTSATRPTATAVAPGQLAYETDTKRWIFSDAAVWRYVPGQDLYLMASRVFQQFKANTTGAQVIFTTPDITVNANEAILYTAEFAWGSGVSALNAYITVDASTNSGSSYSLHSNFPYTYNSSTGADWGIGGSCIYLTGATTKVRFRLTINPSNNATAYDVGQANTQSTFVVRSTGRLSSEVATS